MAEQDTGMRLVFKLWNYYVGNSVNELLSSITYFTIIDKMKPSYILMYLTALCYYLYKKYGRGIIAHCLLLPSSIRYVILI